MWVGDDCVEQARRVYERSGVRNCQEGRGDGEGFLSSLRCLKSRVLALKIGAKRRNPKGHDSWTFGHQTECEVTAPRLLGSARSRYKLSRTKDSQKLR